MYIFSKTVVALLFLLIAYLFLEIYFDKITARILIATLSLLYLQNLLPSNIKSTISKVGHTPIIKLPTELKCLVQLNQSEYYCYNDAAKQHRESQENCDIDFYTLGHFIIFGLIGYYSTAAVTYTKILFISIVWELVESAGNFIGFSTNARIYDVLFNLLGFFIGRKFKEYNKIDFSWEKV